MKNEEILKSLDDSIASLKDAIQVMETESNRFYADKDNWRGNFRCDAARNLKQQLSFVQSSRDTIFNNFAIGR